MSAPYNLTLFTQRACETIKHGVTKHSMSASSNPYQSIAETNPKLYATLVEHPEIMVVDCYFQIESLQFHTLYYIAETLGKAGYTADQISQAMKIYMES